MSKYSELRERKLALREEIRGFRMSVDELYQHKRETHPHDRETHNDLDTSIATQKYAISQLYDKLAEIDGEFERLNMEATEHRAHKARRQE